MVAVQAPDSLLAAGPACGPSVALYSLCSHRDCTTIWALDLGLPCWLALCLCLVSLFHGAYGLMGSDYGKHRAVQSLLDVQKEQVSLAVCRSFA